MLLNQIRLAQAGFAAEAAVRICLRELVIELVSIARFVLSFVETAQRKFSFISNGVVRELAAELLELLRGFGNLALGVQCRGNPEVRLRQPTAFRVVANELVVIFLRVGVGAFLKLRGRREQQRATSRLGA